MKISQTNLIYVLIMIVLAIIMVFCWDKPDKGLENMRILAVGLFIFTAFMLGRDIMEELRKNGNN